MANAKDQFFDEMEKGNYKEAIAIFEAHKLSPNVSRPKLVYGGISALTYAIGAQEYEFAEALIKQGADVNARTFGTPVLHHASEAKGVEILLAAGAKIDAAQSTETVGGLSKGTTALINAAINSNREVVQALIKGGAKLDLADKNGKRAIDFAATSNEEIINDLIEAGTNMKGKAAANLRALIADSFPAYQIPEKHTHRDALKELEGEVLASVAANPEKTTQAEFDLEQRLPENVGSNLIEAGDKTQQVKTIDAEVRARVAEKWLGETRKDLDGSAERPKPGDNQLEAETATLGDSEMPVREPSDAEVTALKKSIPPNLENLYLRVGDKFHYQSKPDIQAFQDKGLKLETRSNSEKIALDMVLIASHRGWSDLRVRGSEEFRRQVWLEATARGMEVAGYKPKELDFVLLEKRVAEMPQNVLEAGRETVKKHDQAQAQQPQQAQAVTTPGKQATSTAEATQPAQAAASPATPATAAAVAEKAAERKEGELYGVLLEHGRANYNFDKDEKPSYYVKFQGEDGKEKMQWGVDLGRAMKESRAEVGDKITLTKADQVPVTVDENVRDESGKVVGTRPIGSQRNQWTVVSDTVREQPNQWAEKADALRELPPAEAAKQHPDLVGAAAAMKAAELAAEKMFPKAGPEDRQKFVGMFRESLAQLVETKEVAPKVYVNETVPQKQQKAPAPSKSPSKQQVDVGEQDISR